MGKTTLINDLTNKYQDYNSEDEAYYNLLNEKDHETTQEPTLENLIEQLDFSIKKINKYDDSENIIFDRCPIDFISYAMINAAEEQIDLNEYEIAERFPEIIETMQTLDLVIFLPITKDNKIVYTEENPTYRDKADLNFKKIYHEDKYNLFPEYNHPKIIEIWGDPITRVKKIESYIT